MNRDVPIAIVRDWQDAANAGDTERLLESSAPDVETVGPRGSGYGHESLKGWIHRAGLTLETLRTFARDDTVVVAQHGVWHDAETGEIVGEAEVATRFRVDGGRITQLDRHDALADADLDYENEV